MDSRIDSNKRTSTFTMYFLFSIHKSWEVVCNCIFCYNISQLPFRTTHRSPTTRKSRRSWKDQKTWTNADTSLHYRFEKRYRWIYIFHIALAEYLFERFTCSFALFAALVTHRSWAKYSWKKQVGYYFRFSSSLSLCPFNTRSPQQDSTRPLLFPLFWNFFK